MVEMDMVSDCLSLLLQRNPGADAILARKACADAIEDFLASQDGAPRPSLIVDFIETNPDLHDIGLTRNQ